MKAQKLGSNTIQRIKQISIAVLFLGAAILFYACENNNLEEIKAISAPNELPVMEAENFETTYTDSGIVRFTLKAPKLLRFENDGKTFSEFPFGVEIRQFDAEKNIVSSITADYAKEFLKEEKWEAKNNVIVTNAEGDTLKTDYLIWDRKNGKIHTEEFVKIISEDKIITGTGLVSDQEMKDWEIKKPQGDVWVTVKENNTTAEEGSVEEPEQNETPALPKRNKPNDVIQFK